MTKIKKVIVARKDGKPIHQFSRSFVRNLAIELDGTVSADIYDGKIILEDIDSFLSDPIQTIKDFFGQGYEVSEV